MNIIWRGLRERNVNMPNAHDQSLLDALLDSWERNNTILVNLLRALPEGGLEVRPMEGSPSVGELFTHIHYVRLVFVFEDTPEFAKTVPAEEWVAERDVDRRISILGKEVVGKEPPPERRLLFESPFAVLKLPHRIGERA